MDLTSFAPPSYAGSGTWEVEVGQLLTGSTAVLTSKRVLAASHSLGAGDVTWEGFALPYHAASEKVATEGRLLGNLLGTRATAPVGSRTRFVSSDHRTVIVGADARGVLVKEHLAPDRHATASGRELPVCAAGPGMMWVSLPRHHGPTTVVLGYRRGLVERVGFHPLGTGRSRARPARRLGRRTAAPTVGTRLRHLDLRPRLQRSVAPA